jgi:hypothetical protein
VSPSSITSSPSLSAALPAAAPALRALCATDPAAPAAARRPLPRRPLTPLLTFSLVFWAVLVTACLAARPALLASSLAIEPAIPAAALAPFAFAFTRSTAPFTAALRASLLHLDYIQTLHTLQ